MRLFFVTALVALASVFATTRASAAAKWTFGAKAGATNAALHGDVSRFVDQPNLKILSDLKDRRTGVTGGLYANVRATPLFAVQVEALYIQKGGAGTSAITQNGTTFINADITVELDYLEFPVLAMFTFPANTMELTGYLGLAVGVNTGSKAVITVAGSEQAIDIKSIVRGSEVSGVVGMDLGFGVGSWKVLLGGRYDYSTTNVNSEGSTDIRNGVGSVTVGVTIPGSL